MLHEITTEIVSSRSLGCGTRDLLLVPFMFPRSILFCLSLLSRVGRFLFSSATYILYIDIALIEEAEGTGG